MTNAMRQPLNVRTTKELRDELVAAAEASGRSLAQEVEHRLEMSFFREKEIYGTPETEAFLKMLAMAIRLIEVFSNRRWTEDDGAAAQVAAVVEPLIATFRALPPGLAQQKLADGSALKHVRTIEDFWGVPDSRGAGKPSTPKK